MCRKAFELKSQRIISGLGGSCSSCEALLPISILAKVCACTPGKVLRQINWEWEAEQDDWPEEDKDLENCFHIKHLNSQRHDSLSVCSCTFSTYFSFQ